MKKQLTLAAAALLATGALSAQAQITVDGTISAVEISATNYQLLGRFTTPHVGNGGFGNWGLLSMYAANGGANNSKLYVAVAGTLEKSGNGFQLYVDRPGVAGVPMGTALPNPMGMTMFDGVAGTKLEMDGDMALGIKGDAGGQIPQAVFYTSATAAVSREFSSVLPLPGTATMLPPAETIGAYAGLAGTHMSYRDTPSGSLLTDFPAAGSGPGNPGNTAANPGSAGSFGWEIELSRNSLNINAGGGQVKLMGAYVSNGGYFSSDVIPEVTGNGNTNLGNTPDFTALAGNQGSGALTLTLSTKAEDAAAVAMSVFPNPALSQAMVTYRVLDRAAAVSITLTDLMGRTVKTVDGGIQAPGIQRFELNSSELAAGTYLVKVQVGDKASTRKVVLL